MACRGRQACVPPGAPGLLPANQRTHEKVVAMRSRITRRLVIAVLAVPAIDADAPAAACSEIAVGKAHHRPRAMTPQDATLLVSR